jgi:hypothetical protein
MNGARLDDGFLLTALICRDGIVERSPQPRVPGVLALGGDAASAFGRRPQRFAARPEVVLDDAGVRVSQTPERMVRPGGILQGSERHVQTERESVSTAGRSGSTGPLGVGSTPTWKRLDSRTIGLNGPLGSDRPSVRLRHPAQRLSWPVACAVACRPRDKAVKRLRSRPREVDDAAMTATARAPHPLSVAAFLRMAEAHELAAAVLLKRDPAVAKAHADVARHLRGKASPGA